MPHVTALDVIGLTGVVAMLIAYALTIGGRLDPLRPPALAMNLLGALGVLVSLYAAFNLSSAVIEAAWALIAAAGLVRHAMRRGRRPSRDGAATDGPGERRGR